MRGVDYSGRNYLSKAVKFTKNVLLGGKSCDQAIASVESLHTLKVHSQKLFKFA